MEFALKHGKDIFLFIYKANQCPIQIKNVANSKFLNIAVMKPYYSSVEISTGNKGTHSIWKIATTYARRNGCSKDDIDLRARWKGGHRRMQGRYVSVHFHFQMPK